MASEPIATTADTRPICRVCGQVRGSVWVEGVCSLCRIASHQGSDRDQPATSPVPGDDDPLPVLTVQQFISCVASDTVCDDEVLSARTLRLVLRDYRDHARRLLGTDARGLT